MLMAFHLFNCTIDAPDLTPPGLPEDLSYNEMETVTEFIAEIIFGLDDFFPENDEDDSGDKTILKVKTPLDSFTLQIKKPAGPPAIFSDQVCRKLARPGANQFDHQFFGEPNAPPPWRG